MIYYWVLQVAGHGGTDPGAAGNNIIEKDMNLAISLYQNDRFSELNIAHALTRSRDESLTKDERVKRIKSVFGDDKGVILISNHNNAGGGEGSEVIYALRNTATYPIMILNEIKLTGQKTRTAFQKRLDTEPTKDYYYIMRETTNIQPVIVEYAFLDNAADASRLRYNWMRYAEAVIKATCEYIGYPYRPPYSEHIVYTVQAGDTLFNIAQRFKTTVAELVRINNLTSNTISVGQRLLIPFFETTTPPADTFTHTVVSGDTLFSLANRFGTTVDEIKRINNLTSNALSLGQQLQIPLTDSTTPPTTSRPTLRLGDRGKDVTDLQNLLVSFGYSPGSIDGVFGQGTLNAVKAFQTARGLVSDGVVGAATWNALLSENTPLTHIVVSGDTLFSIANRFGTTVNAILQLNNLTSTTLTLGQRLLIPSGNAPTVITHTVVSGDSLWSIAQRFNTTVNAIVSLNNLTSNLLSIGQQLLIPTA